LNDKNAPKDIFDALGKGMNEVGRKYEKSEFFLSDLIMAGETMKKALNVLMHYMKVNEGDKGKIILGIIEGDLHDIGKNIVNSILTSSGFIVYDLGIDVPPKRFVEKTKETGTDIIGISALLSTSIPTTAKVIEELQKEGLRDKVKVIIGGAAVREWNIEKYGIDAAVNDVIKGINIIQSWVKKD
jgi:methylmalonyl-CoA mutase cobalamin-binding domain/chain